MSVGGRPAKFAMHGQPRVARTSDVAQLVALASRAGERPASAAEAGAPAAQRFAAALHDAAQGLWVVDGARELAAAVHFFAVADAFEVVDVWVEKTWRRRGLAANLLRAASAAAHARGARVGLLEVRRGNAAARALYESLGFTAVGLRRGYYPPHPAEALHPDVGRAAGDALLLRASLPLRQKGASLRGPSEREGTGANRR